MTKTKSRAQIIWEGIRNTFRYLPKNAEVRVYVKDGRYAKFLVTRRDFIVSTHTPDGTEIFYDGWYARDTPGWPVLGGNEFSTMADLAFSNLLTSASIDSDIEQFDRLEVDPK